MQNALRIAYYIEPISGKIILIYWIAMISMCPRSHCSYPRQENHPQAKRITPIPNRTTGTVNIPTYTKQSRPQSKSANAAGIMLSWHKAISRAKFSTVPGYVFANQASIFSHHKPGHPHHQAQALYKNDSSILHLSRPPRASPSHLTGFSEDTQRHRHLKWDIQGEYA